MKKKLGGLLLSAVLVFAFLVGCGGGEAYAEGEVYTLESAYERAFLSKEDIMHVSYFSSGKVVEWVGGNACEIDFTPKTETPVLTSELDKALRQIYYKEYEESFKRNGADAEDVTIRKYYGQYNGYHVAYFDENFTDLATVIGTSVIGGILFVYSGALQIYAVKIVG